MSGDFGWDLPAGCTDRHIDEANGVHEPRYCLVCKAELAEDEGDLCADCTHHVTHEPRCEYCGAPSSPGTDCDHCIDAPRAP